MLNTVKKECKSCWWQEGGKCYEESGVRGRPALVLCNKYWNKRAALSGIIPNEKLVILSEGILNNIKNII
jgi:hypothetical protein